MRKRLPTTVTAILNGAAGQASLRHEHCSIARLAGARSMYERVSTVTR